MADLSFLTDTYERYIANAKKAHNAGNVALAKDYYFKAAEIMLKMAKQSSPKLRDVRVERANRLIDIADTLEGKVVGKSVSQKKYPPKSESERNAENEETLTQWQSATIPDIKFSDVAGLEDVKKAITRRMINPIKYPDKYAMYGKKSGGGVLLYGPPGTGKTMIAKAIANEVGAKFYCIKCSDVVSKWVGDSEKNIKSLFDTARGEELAIIFIDEMDSLFGVRGVDSHNDKRVNEFLQQIDGFAGRADNILLLGATNRPWAIDSAAIRSGRFSQKIYVPLPDSKAREYLIKKLLSKNTPLGDDVDIDELVKWTEGYSGADLEEFINIAKDEPLDEYVRTDVLVPVKRRDFLAALRAVPRTVSDIEIQEFDAYNGDNNRRVKGLDNIDDYVEEQDKSQKNSFTIQSDDNLDCDNIVVKKTRFNLDEKICVEFFAKDIENAYVVLQGAKYHCFKNFVSYVSERLPIERTGNYDVEIFNGDDARIAQIIIRVE